MNQDTNFTSRLHELVDQISRSVSDDGIHSTPIQRLFLIRRERPSHPMPSRYTPSLCVIAQGSKRVMLGDEKYIYDPSRYLVTSVELPVLGEVLEATPEKPYLCVMLEIDPKQAASILLETDLPPADAAPARGLYTSQASLEFLDALLRLVRLLRAPEDIAALAPLAEREILYRLLKSQEGWRLREIVSGHGHARRIAKSIDWLKNHFHEPLSIETLAEAANMSSSSFHAHFRNVTAMSPLQYQKQLRLQEARRLLLTFALDAATAGHRVGYESPSQFSREYRRLFGTPPAKDAQQLRREPVPISQSGNLIA